MKLVKRFSRRLKTSRKFVIENIMDLDHVCNVHRRWFRNLRIRKWREDAVDYRLTSRFYGLSQEVDVRGGPIDADRYWYEFNAPLASIRVDGRLDGPDGNLDLTETITYRFAWPLAPVFVALSPLFARQKLDILRDDGALLEREYELEREGFERTPPSEAPIVVVYGGAGFFGRCVVDDLLRHTDAQVRVASRRPRCFTTSSAAGRLRFYLSDVTDRESVAEVLRGASVVINCMGPFQGMGLDLLEACIHHRVHYVDVADDRDFVERAHRLEPQIVRANVRAFIGCSAVPGLSAMLTEQCAATLGDVDWVRVSITPGTSHTRGIGSFESLLSTVGEKYDLPRQGKLAPVVGWTEPETVHFPPPLGRRTVYTVVDVGDYFVLREIVGLESITFKIGSELMWLNWALSGLRMMKQLLRLTSVRHMAPVLRLLLRTVSWTGRSQGGIMVEARRGSGGNAGEAKFSVYRESDAYVIPALLPSIATDMLLRGRPTLAGIVSLSNWIPFEELLAELSKRGVSVAECKNGEWQSVSL